MDKQLLQQLYDEYALGLLEGEERLQIDGLIASRDSEAMAQLRASESFVASLSVAAVQTDPPVLLRSRLLNQVAGEERRRGEQPATSIAPPARRGWVVGWAVAAGLAVASLYSFMALRGAQTELRRVEGQLASVRAEAEQSRKVLQVVLARDAKFIRLSTSPNEPVFRAFWGGTAGLVLSGTDVPAPKAGRTFQLWVVPKGGSNPVSAGVFVPGANGQVLMFAAGTGVAPGDAAALAISDEPEGGSPQPTTTPVYVGTVGD